MKQSDTLKCSRALLRAAAALEMEVAAACDDSNPILNEHAGIAARIRARLGKKGAASYDAY